VEPEEVTEEETVAESKETPRTVLVAEDHFVNQQLFQTILEKRGFTVLLASDGLEAIRQVKTEPEIGLIFMDVQMPNLNGFDATQRIRELGVQVPIVAVTANALSGDRDRSLRVGMDDYVAKPFKIGDIDAVVERLKNAGKFGPLTGDAPLTEETQAPPSGPEQSDDLSSTDSPDDGDTNLDYDDDESEEGVPIDVRATVEAFMGDVDIAERVVREFAARLPEQIQQVKDYLEMENIADARVIAHAIKGGAWNLNSTSLGNAAREVEDACRDEDGNRALALLPAVSSRAEEFAAFVDSFDFDVFR